MIKKSIEYFYSLPEKIRFIISGGLNTFISYGLFLGLYYIFYPGLNYQAVFALSFVLSTFTAFVNLKLLVFRTKGHILTQFSKTFLSYVCVYIVNATLLHVFVEFFAIIPQIAQALCIIINAVVSYCLHKHFSFKERRLS